MKPQARTRTFRALTVLLPALILTLGVSGGAGAQPTFSKEFIPSTIGPESVSTLVFTIANPDTTPVSDLAFTDDLPAGVVIATPANAFTTCALGILSAPEGDDTISLTGGRVGGSETCVVSVDVTSSASGTHMNVSGDLTSSAGNSGPASADLFVDTLRPGFTKSFSPGSITPGRTSTLTFVIDNTHSRLPATDLTFADVFPSGMVVANPANASTSCGGEVIADPDTNLVTFYGGSVDALDSCTVSVDVTAAAAGTFGNTSSDLVSSRGSSGKAGATLDVALEFLSKAFVDDPVPPGGTTTLEFTVTNLDRGNALTGITFTDDLGAALTGLTAVGLPANDVCGAGSQISGADVLTLTGGNLPPAGSCTFGVTVQVPANAAYGAHPNTTSSITGQAGGLTVEGSPAVDDLVVLPIPVLNKTITGDPVGPGGSVTLEFTIQNTDPESSLTEITFVDDLGAFLPGLLVFDLPSPGFCGPGSSLTVLSSPSGLVLSLGDFLGNGRGALDPGGSCTFDMTLQLPADALGGTYVNTSSQVLGLREEIPVVGDPAEDEMVVVGAPSLSKNFTDDPAAPGDPVTLEFTLSHSPEAPGDATGISFSDDLDAALSGLAATGLPAHDVCGAGSQLSGTGNLSFTGGSLAPGESCTFSVSVQVPPGALPGNHVNTTSSVSATVLGSAATSNRATDILHVTGLSLTKVFEDHNLVPGQSIPLNFALENTSPFAVTDILFLDDLNAALPGLVATALPPDGFCGAGSHLSGTGTLILTGGNLAPGGSCSFDVTVEVPPGAAPGEYTNQTSPVSASVEGMSLTVPGASDPFTVIDPISLTKTFLEDPAAPGGTTTLEFLLTNNDPGQAVTGISFSDDLDAALSGLVAAGLPASDVCGAGSSINGTSLLTLTGGELAPGGSCSFHVQLAVPAGTPPGTVAFNTTSPVTGMVGGVGVTGAPAADDLGIAFMNFSKVFDGVALAGGTSTLTFTIENLSSTAVSSLGFTDDLDAVLPGLAAVGLPLSDVCGAGSQLSGTSFLTLTGGSLGPGEACTFDVPLQIPVTAVPGSFLNTTCPLVSAGLEVAEPAFDTLTVIESNPPVFTKDFEPGSIPVGGISTLTFTINNTGSLISASALDFTDLLPGGVMVADPANASTTCTGGTITSVPGTGAINYTGGSVAAGGVCAVEVDVTSDTGGTYGNISGDFTSSLGNSGPASDTLVVAATAPGFTKAFDPPAVESGGVTTLIFTIDNTAGLVSATSLHFTDNLPVGMIVADPADASTTCTGGTITAIPGTRVIAYEGGEVGPGSVCTVRADVRMGGGGSLINTSGDLSSSLGSSTGATAELRSGGLAVPSVGTWGSVLLSGVLFLLVVRRLRGGREN